MKKSEWWKTFFDENYITLWTARGIFDHTREEVIFLRKVIPLKPDQEILDLCCGHGRHSIELAKRGYRVTGLDYSAYELGVAKKQANHDGLKIDFVRADARNFNLRKKFDVIINMFTAFGYGSEEDDRKIIKNAVKHLKPGGKFFIEMINLPWLWRNYKSKDQEKFGKLTATMQRDFDFLNGINHEKRIFKAGTRTKVYDLFLRVYSLYDLSKLLESEGLRVIRFWGKGGESYGLKTKRMLVLAKRI